LGGSGGAEIVQFFWARRPAGRWVSGFGLVLDLNHEGHEEHEGEFLKRKNRDFYYVTILSPYIFLKI